MSLVRKGCEAQNFISYSVLERAEGRRKNQDQSVGVMVLWNSGPVSGACKACPIPESLPKNAVTHLDGSYLKPPFHGYAERIQLSSRGIQENIKLIHQSKKYTCL